MADIDTNWLDEIIDPLKRGAGVAQRNEAKASITKKLNEEA